MAAAGKDARTRAATWKTIAFRHGTVGTDSRNTGWAGKG